MHKLMAQNGIWRAGTETPDTLAGHPVSPEAYQRTVAGLKNAYANKVPLTFSTDADSYVEGKTRGEVCLEFLKTWKDAAIPNEALKQVQFVMKDGLVFKRDGVMTPAAFFHGGPVYGWRIR